MSERVILVVHHFVEDFDTWKPVFDEHEAVRRSHGEIEHRLYQDIHNPNRLVIHNDFPSAEAAQGFGSDPSLPEAMERAGVTGEPSISVATLGERKRYAEGDVGVTFGVHHPGRDFDVEAGLSSTRPFAAGTARSSTGSTAYSMTPSTSSSTSTSQPRPTATPSSPTRA